MIINIVLILGIIFASLKIQQIFKVPSTLSLMTLSILIGLLFPNFLNFTSSEIFAEEMLVFIVLLVLGDAFILKLEELKEHALSIFILSCVFVVIAILLGVAAKELIFPNLNISTGALIALFAMITATDPVSVISVFNQYKLPHKLKFLAEGESLFNDAMALTMFSAFGIYLMINHDLTLSYGVIVISEIFIGSTIIGVIIGLLGLLLLKTTKDTKGEFILILFTAYLSFFIAEHTSIIGGNHLSGLLSEIIAILTMTTLIDRSYERENKHILKEKKALIKIGSNNILYNNQVVNKLVNKLIHDISDVERQNDILSFIDILSLLVSGILFVSLAHIIKFDMILFYWKEILSIFALTTLIRMFLMGSFAFFTFKTGYIKEMNVRWFFVLTFAGIKGGLSIVMLHMLNMAIPNFEHKELFESIVIGVILLSTFIYVFGLMITIGLNKQKFVNEANLELH